MRSHPHFLWTDLFRPRTRENTTITDALRSSTLFRTLTRRELRYVSTLVYERVYQPGEPIFAQNDRGLGLYIIAKGRVAIKTQSPQGETFITNLEEGACFGELALVNPDDIRTASAIPIDKTVVIGFFRPDLFELLKRKPATAVKILFQLSTVLGRRLIETTEKITLLSRVRGDIGDIYEEAG